MMPAHETIGTEHAYRLGAGEAGLWTGAFAVVLAVTAATGFVAHNWQHAPELPGAPPPALMIELAPVAVAPQVEDIAADAGPEMTPDTISDPQPEPEIEPQEEPAPDEPPPEALEETPPEPVTEPEPEVVEDIMPDTVETPVADPAVPLPVALSPRLREQRDNAPRTIQQPPRPKPPATPRPPTAPRTVEAQQSTQTAAPQQTSSTQRAPSISPERWQSQVLAHLERKKRYPEDAKRRREQGMPYLQFTINASGQVTSSRIVRSSGFPALDQAALDLIARASPVPVPPASIAQSSMTLTVPIDFNIR